MDYEERNRKFKDLIHTLIKQARADGMITSEEEQLLNTVRITTEQYEMALNKAVEDEIITDQERLKLAKIEDRLLSTTFELVERDEDLDTDTKLLVELLFDSLMNVL